MPNLSMTFLKLIANCHKWLLALITKLNKKLNNEKLASHAITNKPPHRWRFLLSDHLVTYYNFQFFD